MSRAFNFLIGILCLLGIVFLWFLAQAGSGTRTEPGAMETVVSRRLRSLTMPSTARAEKNPLTASAQVMQEAAQHFADHCASCHANDGSGNTSQGQKLYPRAPDMRLAATQQLSDGELYYIIHNGVRFTGMPAWGESEPDEDSWKLVLFIRHLPSLTAQEIHEMERFNPRSPVEIDEEKAEQDFLNGGAAPAVHEHH
jgi:mono/diheme cytochrome c family protein